MKVAKALYTIISIIPFIWFVTFLLQLLIGIIHFKTIPREGIQSDPCSIGLCTLHLYSAMLLAVSVFAIAVWAIMSVTLLTVKKKSLSKPSTLLCIISVIGYFVFAYGFPEVFGWVLD
jgi:hypothetical protein